MTALSASGPCARGAHGGPRIWSQTLSRRRLAALHVSTGVLHPSSAGHEVQGGRQLGGRALGVGRVVAVGLVDGDHVGQLEHALLDALQAVAGRASVRNRNVSTMLATVVSDCPTPTVSTNTTS